MSGHGAWKRVVPDLIRERKETPLNRSRVYRLARALLATMSVAGCTPTEQAPIEAEKGSAIVVLAKKIDEAGTETLLYKFSDGDQTSWDVGGPEDIYLEASRIIAGNATRQFILKADGTVRFELIDELLDSMREGGVANVLLLTSQQTVPESGV